MTKIKPKEHKPKSIRDPIHGFVEITADEQKIVDSPQFQRLRDISQLSFTHLVYPGATHKRFEHSLGVMHVASEIFDRVLDKLIDTDRFSAHQKKKYQEEFEEKDYWRQVLRLAALCHDIGHLPFSHTLEGLLKSKGANKNHETLSHDIIQGEEGLKEIIESITAGKSGKKINAREVSFIAMGRKNREDIFAEDGYSDAQRGWMSSLGDIISSDFFGADRMDYLVRDAYHAGVPYGKVDIPQLYRSILNSIPNQVSITNLLDINVDNIHEGDLAILTSFLMSRQLMYSQVYQHPVCKVNDEHLKDFVSKYVIPKKILGIESLEDLVKYTDSDLLHILYDLHRGSDSENKYHAERLLGREHFQLVASMRKEDVQSLYAEISRVGDRKVDIIDGNIYIKNILEHLQARYGEENIRRSYKISKGEDKGRKEYAKKYDSRYRDIFKALTTTEKDDFVFCYLYAHPDKAVEIKKYLDQILQT